MLTNCSFPVWTLQIVTRGSVVGILDTEIAIARNKSYSINTLMCRKNVMSVLRNCPTNCSLVDEYSLQKPVAIRFSKSRRGVTVHGRVISIHVHDLFMVTSKPFEMRVLWEEITIKASRDAYALLLLSTIDDTDVQPTWAKFVKVVYVLSLLFCFFF